MREAKRQKKKGAYAVIPDGRDADFSFDVNIVNPDFGAVGGLPTDSTTGGLPTGLLDCCCPDSSASVGLPIDAHCGAVVQEILENTHKGVKSYYYSMSRHAEKCVERYLELAEAKLEDLKIVSTPCIDDHQISAEKFAAPGTLAPVCSRIVLKVRIVLRSYRSS